MYNVIYSIGDINIMSSKEYLLKVTGNGDNIILYTNTSKYNISIDSITNIIQYCKDNNIITDSYMYI